MSGCGVWTHQFLSSKDRKSGGVGLEAEVVLARGVSCEAEFTKFTKAFGHLDLRDRTEISRTKIIKGVKEVQRQELVSVYQLRFSWRQG